eukprot:16439624-Heterocapsa_arctica.AAC.1
MAEDKIAAKPMTIAVNDWDEYDNIWGFDNVPRGFPVYEMHVKAHLDRHNGIPTLIEVKDLPELYNLILKKQLAAERHEGFHEQTNSDSIKVSTIVFV